MKVLKAIYNNSNSHSTDTFLAYVAYGLNIPNTMFYIYIIKIKDCFIANETHINVTLLNI